MLSSHPSSSSASSSQCSMSSSPSSSSQKHPASLVDPAKHSPALLALSSLTMSKPVVEYVADFVTECVDPTSVRSTHCTIMVYNMLYRARVSPGTLLTALAYIARARTHLSIPLEADCTPERIFLGALIVANKYTNDSPLRNAHWGIFSAIDSLYDIALIEREFLDTLHWELGVSEAEVEAEFVALVSALEGEQHRWHTPMHPVAPRTRNPSVPELEPSSPASSAASVSPRTPASRASSPHPHAPRQRPVPMEVNPAPHHPHPHQGGKLLNFLRALHIPRRHHHPAIRVAA
ncbi:hypothetical protein B0H15DRAFT_929674 [Mycena belliarum]|uniref:Cyclin N-terminal domain-containing protein n=1 Tax=Mycena belliarum TaxID=1033014 RepID=A0AAD6XP54_9AGAR|nr:hypothetical protein B0H15DRAFT_929674 [Mycena belliae]